MQEQKRVTRKTIFYFKGRLDVMYVIVLITLLVIVKLTRVRVMEGRDIYKQFFEVG